MAKLFISAIAKKKGITISKLAEAIGTTQPNASNISNGKVWPKEDTLDKIAAALGVEVYQLFLDPDRVPEGSSFLICPYCHEHFEISIKPAL